MINLESLESDQVFNITLQNIMISYSSVAFLSSSTFTTVENNSQSISMNNVTISHCYMEFSIDLIHLGKMQGNNTLMISMDQLYFNNITFLRGGYLVNFKHQTTERLILNNTIVSNITNGGVNIQSYDLTDLARGTKVAIYNMTVSSIEMGDLSFIQMND